MQEQKSAATGQVLVNLPEKKVETHTIKLSPEEQKVYDKVGSSQLTYTDLHHLWSRVCIKSEESNPDQGEKLDPNPDPDPD